MMNFKKIILFLLLSVFLQSCASTGTKSKKKEKIDYQNPGELIDTAQVRIDGQKQMDKKIEDGPKPYDGDFSPSEEERRITIAKEKIKSYVSISDDYSNLKQNISLNLQGLDFAYVMSVMADIGNVNILVGDEVSGTVNAKFKNVPWDVAFQTLLDMKTLAADIDAPKGIIRVHTPDKLKQQETLKSERNVSLQKRLAADESVKPVLTQLFKLYYLSLLGMDFDIVINFDGPQEMAQPYVKNVPIKDELIYPRRFSDDIAYMTRDFSCISKNNKESLKNSFIPVVEFFSYLVIRNCHRDISLFDGYPAFWKSIISTNSKNEEEIAKKSYEIWKNSSLEIENFSKLKNFFYLHVIMPSQYVEDSKKFSSKESDEFIGYEYGPIISKYYSKMINFNNLNLKNSLDLKYIFKNETKTVYRDRCCRFNDYGLNAIASEISKYIGQNY